MTRAVFTTAVLAFASSVASADTISVCLDGSCDYTDIQEAIFAASDGDVIEIAAGTYYPAATIDTWGKAVTLMGEVDKDGAPTTVIDGQDSIRVLICENGEGAGTMFENLYITGGSGAGGGGMYNYESSPTLTNCTFTGNLAVGLSDGGGMANRYSSPRVRGCMFTNNSGDEGGGMNNFFSSPMLTNCTFEGNSATGTYGEGGGMANNFDSSPTLTGCTFSGNTADCAGGGMANNFDSSPTLENCTFTSNSASDEGGGMSGSGDLTNCTFEGNSADYGGGMYNDYGSPTLTDTTLCGNSPDQVFGGWTDNGGNCLSFSCADDDGDGVPDKCGGKGGAILLVPSEYPTIESAIVAAAYGDVIEIAAGTYQPTETLNTQGKPITLRGAIDGEGQPATIIDGQNSIRVLQCTSGEGPYTVFENLLITGGSAEGDGSDNRGGGMHNYCSSPTLRNCTFESNSATNRGGGMYNSFNSSPTLTGCVFEGNSATTYGGGGMYNWNNSSPTLTDCTFTNNSADRGGGMYNLFGSSPTLTGCTFSGNSADYGGGMYNYSGSSPALTDCTFTGNSATVYGGGMANDDRSSPTLADTTVCGNTPDQIDGDWTDNGGNCVQASCYACGEDGEVTVPGDFATITEAIAVVADGWIISVAPGTYNEAIDFAGKAITVEASSGFATTILEGWEGLQSSIVRMTNGEGPDSVLRGFTITNGVVGSPFGGTQVGGALYTYESSPTIENCLFEENSAEYGGAVFSREGAPVFLGCTFRNNTADVDGGAFQFSRTDAGLIDDCVFEDNNAGSNGGAIHLFGGSPKIRNSVINLNTTELGGGGGISWSSTGDPAYVQGCLITGNSASIGGGIWIDQSTPDLDLIGTTVCGNTPDQINGEYNDSGGNCVQASCHGCGTAFTVCLDGSCDYTDIQEAINAASDGDVFEIAAGTYYPAATIDTLGKAVTLRGEVGKDGSPTTVIDGQDSIRVLQCVSGEGAGTVFENLLITGGYTSGYGGGMANWYASSPTLENCVFEGNSATNYGGCMYNNDSSPTLENCTFTNNSSDYGGGGMSNTESSPTLTNCTFTGNNSADGGGGGMRNAYSSPTLENCTFGDNSADTAGGGMFNYNDSKPTLENCAFEGNSAYYGGGMYNNQSSSPTLSNCTFTGNSAVDDGGGMYSSNKSSPTLIDCTFTGNSVDRFGGGMANWYASSPTLENCVFEGNSANDLGSGGGMYNFSNSSPTLTGCVFKGNYAMAYGGGMVTYGSSSPTLVNCSFVLNEACYGGGVYCVHTSDPTFVGCTIQMNDAYCSGPGIPGPAGGIWIDSNCDPVLENCAICGNSSGQVYGSFTDNGGNCVQESCDDCQDCVADLNADGQVNGQDLGVFLVEWGECAGCAADLNGDGFVDGGDLGAFLVAWGPCP